MRFTVVLIPGKLSVEADVMSRKFNDCTEWKLDKKKKIQKEIDIFGKPQTDLFASRLNYQLKPFVLWSPDLEAFSVDTFTITWANWNLVFPPFSLTQKVLDKLRRGRQGCC